MIELKHGMSRQKIYASKVSLLDFFIPATYQHYEGEGIPPFFKKVVHNTNVIDLSQDLDTILSNMKSNTRNEIRRAEREGCYCIFNDNVSEFIPFYNDFAKEKGLYDTLSRHGLTQYGQVCIGLAKHNDTILSMHATAFDLDLKKAMLLYSCSPRLSDGADKKMIGWGNRYLHFKEFEHFKQMGMVEYDWNGICLDPLQTQKYNIGLFKQAFGGQDKENVWLYSPLYILLKKVEGLIRGRITEVFDNQEGGGVVLWVDIHVDCNPYDSSCGFNMNHKAA